MPTWNFLEEKKFSFANLQKPPSLKSIEPQQPPVICCRLITELTTVLESNYEDMRRYELTDWTHKGDHMWFLTAFWSLNTASASCQQDDMSEALSRWCFYCTVARQKLIRVKLSDNSTVQCWEFSLSLSSFLFLQKLFKARAKLPGPTRKSNFPSKQHVDIFSP